MSVMMCSFDEVQCEEVYYCGSYIGTHMTLEEVLEAVESEDILDVCEVVSLDGLKSEDAYYRMEDEMVEEFEYDELADINFPVEDVAYNRFGLRKVGL